MSVQQMEKVFLVVLFLGCILACWVGHKVKDIKLGTITIHFPILIEFEPNKNIIKREK